MYSYNLLKDEARDNSPVYEQLWPLHVQAGEEAAFVVSSAHA